jgi:hypothetical protein
MNMRSTFFIGIFLLATAGCTSKASQVTAKKIGSRAELIGGPSALGEVGDYLLANEQVRIVIQGPGYSRGFGLYGGSLIDADLVRPRGVGDSTGGKGYDNFSELFPGIFLKAMKPNENGIVTKDYEDGSASVIVTGRGEEFLFVAERIDDLLVNADKLIFQNEYKLSPGKRYVEITTKVINQGDATVQLPSPGITDFSESLQGFKLPLGDVLLFGSGNDVFSEKAGFDLRFTLEELYKTPPGLPRLPGLTTKFLATRGDKISYGFMSAITDPERSFAVRTGYENAQPDDMIVPFIASSFTGVFYGAAPDFLEPRMSFEYKKYFIVGGGDVASIRDVVLEIRNAPTGTFAGTVYDALTRAPEAGVSVVTYDANGSPYNQHTTDERGNFRGNYEPGTYSYRVVSEGRPTTAPVAFTVKLGETSPVEIFLDPPGMVAVRIVDEDGRPLPAKCSLVGQYSASSSGFDPKSFLYDLKVGEAMRSTDLIPDTDDPSTREFVEHVVYATLGRRTDKVRPGKYRAVCSRGMEYEIVERELEVQSGQLAEIDVMLERAIDTTGWASGDYHLHADPSIDSAISIEDRVAHCAIEGLDIACSSDHNYVTDYQPAIAAQGLEPWIQGMVGLEMTTLEIGHFNGFPLSYDPGPITKGAFEWSGRKPADIFSDLRSLGRYGPEHTVVQVNHPRDTILGYFNDYNLDADTSEPQDAESLLSPMGPEFGKDKFSYEFDALEIYNGKRYDLMHSYRVPEQLPPPPLPENIPPAGTILRDEDGKVAFPGAMEDWFNLLNRGYIYTAMANSDTHAHDDEPGIPRTYVPVSSDQPGAIIEPEIVAAIKNQQAMLTNGPFLRISARGAGCRNQANEDLGRLDCGMGEVALASNGSVQLTVTSEMASWVTINKVSIIRGGEVVRTLNGDKTTLARVDVSVPISGDTFVVVEVTGEDSLWPVALPREVPSLQVSDALQSIGGSFGVNFAPFGNLKPSQITIAKSFAFTNPIFVDANGDGRYAPPGASGQALRVDDVGARVKGKRPDAQRMPILMKLFGAFGCHAH